MLPCCGLLRVISLPVLLKKDPCDLSGLGVSLLRRICSNMDSFHAGSTRRKKHVNPAAERNKEPILEILKKYILPPSSEEKRTFRLLEISSGSGQHVVHFAPHFPWVTFQPTEFDDESLSSIAAYYQDAGMKNIKPPIYLDVTQSYKMWDGGRITENSQDYVLNINMIHITPYACTKGLFTNGGAIIRSGGILFTYGPYAFNGKITPDSNVRFDASLRSQDPEWGLKDVQDLTALASECGFELESTHDMPANNHVLVWRKK